MFSDAGFNASLNLVDSGLGALALDPRWSGSWLLSQTAATSASRRALVWSLPVPPGATAIDVGCGFGAFVVELATRHQIRSVGVDFDSDVLGAARQLGSHVSANGGLAPGSTVGFAAGDSYALPFPDRSVDFAAARFLFQHLGRPEEAAAELARVTRPGAVVCVIDADDGLSISEPPPSPEFERLASALRSVQTGSGGNRFIGRRLAGVLDSAGFAPAQVLVLPQASYTSSGADDPARRVLVQRFQAARTPILERRIMTAAEFDADLRALAEETPGPVCEIEGHIAVVATRRS